LWGHTAENWDWRDRGVVLFLAAISYSRNHWQTSVIVPLFYAEWSAQQRWIDRFGVMNPEMISVCRRNMPINLQLLDLMVEAGE